MIELTREELKERFDRILQSETLFGTLWTNADRDIVEKLLFELSEELVQAAFAKKIELPPNSGIDWLIAAGASPERVNEVLEKEKREKEVTDAYERAMGYNPLEWLKLERLQRFLMTKTVEEIQTFARWCKIEYSTFTPAKARQYPDMVIDLFPLAFEKATIEQNNTQDAVREAIYGKSR
jgi:hypothetical protein